MKRAGFRYDWLALWILWSAWCTLCGWGLSAVGHLDWVGYTVAVLVFVTGVFLARRWFLFPGSRPLFLLRRSTYRRLAPKLWLLLVAISLVEGLCYHGDNYDYLTYRIPRLLHWCWAHHWYWVHTTNLRINLSATGFEWLMAPIFVFFQTDRPFFVINLVSYLLLPGLVFAVLRGLGVNGRVAWWWMWVMPGSLCCALQAGGLGNDMFACVYLLASFHYLIKMREGNSGAMVLAILSIALLTNTKFSNIPLAVPWLAVALVTWQRLPPKARNWPLLAGSALVGLLVSAAVIIALNYHFTGIYTGDPGDYEKVTPRTPLVGFVGNGIMTLVANLAPPFLPHDIWWSVLPAGYAQEIARDFPRFLPRSPALMLEESCSFGIGASFFLLLAFSYGIISAVKQRSLQVVSTLPRWLALGTGTAWLVFMGKLASDGAPRLLTPYYILTAVATLAVLPFDGRLTHRLLWRGFAYFTLGISLAVVAATPGRPLLPPPLMMATFNAIHAPAGVAKSWEKNRQLRVTHFDMLRELRRAVPASETRIGLVEGDDVPGTSLWLPYGSREVVELEATLSAAAVKAQGIHYVAVNASFLSHAHHISIGELAQKWGATDIFSEVVQVKTTYSEDWHLLRLP